MPDEDAPRRPAPSEQSGVDAFARLREAASERRAPTRPMLPIAAALLCAGLVAAGSLGPWLQRRRGLGRPVETLDGFRLDGELSLMGAVVAAVALVVVLARPGVGIAAWVALGGLAGAAGVGVADWLVLDTAGPGYVGQTRGASYEVAWGLILVTAAGLVGTACAALVLRRLD